MKINVYTVSSFAKTKEGGNAAGVVLNADSLTETEMRRTAAVLGFSETAFVLHSDKSDFKVRFFTPKDEVDLCGHATIATFYTMAGLHLLEPRTYNMETKAGVLGIDIKEDHSVMMEQVLPVFSEIIDKEELTDSLGLRLHQFKDELPIQVVSTGLRDIVIPVKDMETLKAIVPDMEKITNISRKYNVVGYHVFALAASETPEETTAICRNFAPLFDIPEEAATGTSNGALGCYLYQYGCVNAEQAADMLIEQGNFMNKPSQISVSLTVKEKEILAVKVGGSARNLTLTQVEI